MVSRRSFLPRSVRAAPAGRLAQQGGIHADVFATALAGEIMSRDDIAQTLGISSSTVTRAVKRLVDNGYLEDMDAEPRGDRNVGRPSRLLRVNKARHAVIGIKAREDRLIGVLTNLRTEILDCRTVPITDRSPSAVLGAVERLASTLAAASGDDSHVLGLGVGISGHVDSVRGMSRYSALLGWRDVDVVGRLSTRTGLRTIVGNDVNTLALGERWFGTARTCESFVLVTVGTGIGCGLFLDGRLHTGVSGLAGEIGHTPVQPDGPLCNCGRRGCLEAVASYDAVLSDIAARGGPTCRDIDEAIDLARAESGHPAAAAAAAFSAAGDALGRALAWLYNMLNPARLIIAGEGVKAQDLYRPSMMRALRAHTFSTAADDCDDITILIDDNHWARGSACLVIADAIGSLDFSAPATDTTARPAISEREKA